MKRKLVQTEFTGHEKPTKVYHASVLSESANYSNISNNSTGSPTPGKPFMSSSPTSGLDSGYRATAASLQQQQQQTTRMDSGTEAELRRVIDNFVNIYEQLDKCEGADVKPNYSYTELAYLAMLRSPNFCLPITEIYSYIQSRFLFFKNSTRKHWKNAVRHSLAKTMCFTKIPIGRGVSNCENLSRSTYLWCIIPNSISCFARGDYRPTVDKESGTNTLRWGYYRVNAGQFWDQVGNYIADKMVAFRKHLQDTSNPGAIFESQTCSLSNSNYLPRSNTRQPLQQYQSYNSCDMTNQCTMKSPQAGTPIFKFEASPTSHLRYDPNVSSPHMRIPVAQSHNSMMHQHSPNFKQEDAHPVNDPWMPKVALTSPNTSMCSTGSGRRTPPYATFDYRDSGNETCESSPEENSCRILSSCRQQQYGDLFSSPVFAPSLDTAFPDEHDLDQLELSPLGGKELSNFCNSFQYSCEQRQPLVQPNFSDINYCLNISPHTVNCISPVTSPTPTNSQYQHQYYNMTESPTFDRNATPQYSSAHMYMVGNNPMMSYEWQSLR